MSLFSKPSKVKRNIMISITLFAVVTLISLWFFQFVFLSDFYSQVRRMTVEETAERIMRAIDSPELGNVVQDVSEHNDLCVRVLGAGGRDMFSYENTHNCDVHNLDASDIQKLYEKAIENRGEHLEKSGNDANSIIYARVVSSMHGQYLILIGSSLVPLTSTTETLKFQFIFLGCGFLMLALILTWSLSRTISRPLAQLSNDAKRLAKGDYNVRFKGEGFVEVEELSDTLNYATKELQKLDKLKDELIANISHDLRTPLTLITGYGEVMRDIPGENTPENIQVIIDEAKHLSEIVNELLDLSKLRSGEMPIVKEKFDCSAFLQRILDRYSRLTGLEGYDITFDNQVEQPVFVNADANQIERVVSNLINNAINYTGEDKKVVVRQKLKNDDGKNVVRVEVVDTGKGIPQDEIEHIWDRYYRSKDEHKRASIGSGLGLSIVKVLLDLHGAKYGVMSSTSGSVFWFELAVS